MEFHFWSIYFVLFENWKRSPCHQAKICPKKAGFSAFLSHGKFMLVMKKSWLVLNFVAQFLCEPCLRYLELQYDFDSDVHISVYIVSKYSKNACLAIYL